MYRTLNITDRSMIAAMAVGLALVLQCKLRADSFGTGANSFTIDFVTVGHSGNGTDTGAGGGSYSSHNGGVLRNEGTCRGIVLLSVSLKAAQNW